MLLMVLGILARVCFLFFDLEMGQQMFFRENYLHRLITDYVHPATSPNTTVPARTLYVLQSALPSIFDLTK